MNRSRNAWLPWLATAAIAAYLIVFYATPLGSVSQILGQPFARFQVLVYALIPDEIFRSWLGNEGKWGLGDRFIPLGASAVIILTSWGCGTGILRFLGLAGRCRRLERSVIALAVGLNFFSTGILILGLLGFSSSAPPVAGLLLAMWMLFLAGELRVHKRSHRGQGDTETGREISAPGLLRSLLELTRLCNSSSGSERAARKEKTGAANEPDCHPAAYARALSKGCATSALAFNSGWLIWPGVVACLILLQGVLPPTDFDVREYHLQAPKEFYLAGAVRFLPHNVYANMPLGVAMHALGAMAMLGNVRDGALAGKTVTAFFGLILMAAVYSAARNGQTRSHAVAACVTVGSTPWLINVSTAGLNDIALAAYVFLAFHAFTRAWPSRTRSVNPQGTQVAKKVSWTASCRPDVGWVSVAGYLAGAAAACKYTGLVYSVMPLAVLLAWRCRRRLDKQAATLMLAFALAVALGGGAWYAKNAVLCGNPTYPLLYHWFGGGAWNEQKSDRWNRVHAPPDFSPTSLAQDAIRLTVTNDWLGPLVWPFALLGGLAVGRLDGRRKGLWLMTVWLAAVWWLMTHRIDRFWLPLLPFLAVTAADGLHAFTACRIWRWFTYAAAASAIAMTLLLGSAGICSYNRMLAPLSELWDDPNRIGEVHVMLNRMWQEVFSGKLLTVGDAAVFDFTMPVVYATCFDDQPWEKLTMGRSPREIHEALLREGIGCVFVNWAEIARYRSPGNYGFTAQVEPKQFHDLVRAGVLQPVLMPDRSPGQAYLVKPLIDPESGSEGS